MIKEIQKLIEAVIALIVGITLLKALPKDMFILGIIPFLIIILAIIILIFRWFNKNFR